MRKKKVKIAKTQDYKVGVCGVRSILKDKLRSVDFENGLAIEVNDEEKETLIALGWGAEEKDDSDSKNIN